MPHSAASFMLLSAVATFLTQDGAGTADSVIPVSVIPVSWNKELLTEIHSPADCATALRSWRPDAIQAGEYYTVEMTMPDKTLRECTTVAEWLAARSQGGYAYTTVDMSMESHFIQRELAYSAIPHLLAAKSSGFDPEEWSRDVRMLISADDECVRGKRRTHAEVEWEFGPNEGSYTNPDEYEWVQVLARGDYDGDGSLDLVVAGGDGSLHGTMRGYSQRLFTRRASGRVVDISARLLDDMPDASAVATLRRDLAASYGLPEGVPLKLQGHMKIDERDIAIEAEIVLTDGFVTGTYQYSRIGTPIEIEGTLGTGQVITLAEYALDEQPNAWFGLKWKKDGDDLVLEGHWHEAMESNAVMLRGPLATPQVTAAEASASKAE